jgi:hypothetical protein
VVLSELQEVDALLEQLELEERAVSLRRRKLHDRIALFPDPTGRLDAMEREVSAERRALHRQIDELRLQRTALRTEQAMMGI